MNIIALKKSKKAGQALLFLFAFFLFQNNAFGQVKTFEVNAFDKVVVSPHIEVVFLEGPKESVVIERIDVPVEKLNVKVKNHTLKLYLDGAEIIPKTKKEYVDGQKKKVSVYNGTVVKAVVTYKNLSALDLRGEESFLFESPVNACDLRMKIYGESRVVMNELTLQELKVTLYGESTLEIKRGEIDEQKFTAYGESKVNSENVKNNISRVVSYGESIFRLNVSDNLKVTSYGESTVEYTGNARLTKGVIIGENTISKM